MRKTSILFFLYAIILAFASGVVQAGTYYVSPSGAAAWASCTNISTSCSWTTAMASAVAGDLVYFRGGTYNVGVIGPERDYANMRPTNSGTAVNPITFKAYPGETPTITGTVDNSGTSTQSTAAYFGCSYVNYITWDGFAATLQLYSYDINNNTETQTFAAWHSNYCTIKNSNFTGVNVGTRGYNTSFVRIEHSDYATIENNYFHDLLGTFDQAVNTTAIWLFDSHFTAVKNNTIANCVGGVYAKTTASNADIYYNFIYNGSNTCFQGVNLNCEADNACTGFSVHQNIIVGCDSGFYFRSDNVASGIKAYNNVLYGPNASDAVNLARWTNVEMFNNVIVSNSSLERFDLPSIAYANNNIFYSTGSPEWYIGWTTPYKTLAAWTAATTFDANSYVENPKFANPGGSKPGDYKINAATKNRGRGGSGYSTVIGAYITGTERIGYLPAPKNMR